MPRTSSSDAGAHRDVARRTGAIARPGLLKALPLAILAIVPIGVAVLDRSDDVVLDNEAGRQMGIALAGKPPTRPICSSSPVPLGGKGLTRRFRKT